MHAPATTLGQLVPDGTEVKSRFGAPRVKTETLASVVPDGTVMEKTCVAPGALKISKPGVEVTWADNSGALSRKKEKIPKRIEKRTANPRWTKLGQVLFFILNAPGVPGILEAALAMNLTSGFFRNPMFVYSACTPKSRRGVWVKSCSTSIQQIP
ncbi:MAG: hypothetical protein ACRD4Y_15680 [Candidatus Acidiferrales bacterium]